MTSYDIKNYRPDQIVKMWGAGDFGEEKKRLVDSLNRELGQLSDPNTEDAVNSTLCRIYRFTFFYKNAKKIMEFTC